MNACFRAVTALVVSGVAVVRSALAASAALAVVLGFAVSLAPDHALAQETLTRSTPRVCSSTICYRSAGRRCSAAKSGLAPVRTDLEPAAAGASLAAGIASRARPIP